MGEGREDLSEDDVHKAHGVSWKVQKAIGGGGKGAKQECLMKSWSWEMKWREGPDNSQVSGD